jgi:myo-inositol-1(or 4)-monophosphatase
VTDHLLAGPERVRAVFGPSPATEDPLLAELAAVALAAAEGAAGLAAAGFGRVHAAIDVKSSATDMVSEIDRGAEELISALLLTARPDDGLLGEEGASRAGSSGIRWVVDPLDGTTNYLFDIPIWSVSVAAERDGHPIVGVVADPSRSEVWAAVAGRGARCNGVPVRVAEGRSAVATALVGTGFGYRAERRAWQAEVIRHLLPQVRDIRRLGSAALDLCWVAGGRLDAYYEWGLNPWDLAAGTVICREAGGIVDILDDRLILATTPSLARPFAELLVASGATSAPDGEEPRHW